MTAVDGVVKRTNEQGRIVVTFEVTVPREDWSKFGPNVSDAVDALRTVSDALNEDVADGWFPSDLIGELQGGLSVESVKIEAVK